MSVHGVGLRLCQGELTDLLSHISRDKLDGRLHFGHHTLSFLDTTQARLAEMFLLGNGADRVDVALDIPSNEFAVATHTALQVHKVVGLAEGANALGDRLALAGKALVFLASAFHVLRHLLQARRRLWGTTWPTLCRLAVGVIEALMHALERLFGLRNRFCGCPLFYRHRRGDRFAQFILHVEEIR